MILNGTRYMIRRFSVDCAKTSLQVFAFHTPHLTPSKIHISYFLLLSASIIGLKLWYFHCDLELSLGSKLTFDLT